MAAADWLMIACVLSFTTLGATWDLLTRRLPNWLTVTSLVAALVFHAVHGYMRSGVGGLGADLATAGLGFATGFGIFFVLWLMGGGGGGDVKLMGALGAWLGPRLLLWVIGGALVVIFLLAIFFVVRRLATAKADGHGLRKGMGELNRRLIPFGVPVAVAAWGILAVGPLLGANLGLIR